MLPGLQTISLRAISEATGLSLGYCSFIKRGVKIPHPRHWPGARPLHHPPVSRHSASLDASYTNGSEIVSVASLLMADLVQAFGFAEPLQLMRDGRIRRGYWERDSRGDVERWAAERDIELIDENV